jgi:hypothetical protein
MIGHTFTAFSVMGTGIGTGALVFLLAVARHKDSSFLIY